MSARLRIAGGFAVLALIAVLASVWWTGDAGSDEPVVEAAPRLKIGKVSGRVERLAADATWAPAIEGDDIALDERLRTGPDGTAVLAVGQHSTVTLAPNTEASMAKLTESISHVRLQTGRISAITEEGRSVRVQTDGSDAQIDSTGASEFIAMADGLGGLVVASREGKVRLSAAGAAVDLAPGEQSSASVGAPPAIPSAIPSTLFLKLLPVPADVQNADTTLTVKTEPGARVRVNGKVVGIATGETMDVPIHLETGSNRIVIEVEDLTGRIVTQEVTVTLKPPTADPIEIRTHVTW